MRKDNRIKRCVSGSNRQATEKRVPIERDQPPHEEPRKRLTPNTPIKTPKTDQTQIAKGTVGRSAVPNSSILTKLEALYLILLPPTANFSSAVDVTSREVPSRMRLPLSLSLSAIWIRCAGCRKSEEGQSGEVCDIKKKMRTWTHSLDQRLVFHAQPAAVKMTLYGRRGPNRPQHHSLKLQKLDSTESVTLTWQIILDSRQFKDDVKAKKRNQQKLLKRTSCG
ncbi:hypothetical protein H6P81_011304 [Aristolochia fimbriata]|uniref:Uncharacterized protein n=1 Tax=Aristolochia fimbriata TaxID=158543 RepID=A0AAV7ERY5_ARIFI|nr:hypothetical protein H6P81_011304 [Aristolochia fimbriata]